MYLREALQTPILEEAAQGMKYVHHRNHGARRQGIDVMPDAVLANRSARYEVHAEASDGNIEAEAERETNNCARSVLQSFCSSLKFCTDYVCPQRELGV